MKMVVLKCIVIKIFNYKRPELSASFYCHVLDSFFHTQDVFLFDFYDQLQKIQFRSI